jgi:hypothetical protein
MCLWVSQMPLQSCEMGHLWLKRPLGRQEGPAVLGGPANLKSAGGMAVRAGEKQRHLGRLPPEPPEPEICLIRGTAATAPLAGTR